MDSELPSPGNNTYIFDPESATEMARLINLDRITTKAMGGPLAEQADTSRLRQVLDVACGPGGWAMDVAYLYPDIDVAGIDISQTMIAYANARARTQNLSNASFGVMNILEPLDFSDNSFDLVNARLLVAVLHREAWPRFLAECFRITRPGSVMRLTDMDEMGLNNSAASEELKILSHRMLKQAGYGFSPDGRTCGMTPMLGRLLRNAGYEDIHRVAHVIDFSAGTEAWNDFYDNIRIIGREIKPLLIKTGLITDERFEQLYQQMLIDLQSSEFCGTWTYQTVWGTKPAH